MHKVSLFDGLDPADAESVKEAGVWREFATGQSVYRHGDPSVSAFCVFSGRVVCGLDSPQGRRWVSNSFSSRQVFGLRDALTDEPRASDATAACEATHLVQIPVRTLAAVMDRSDMFRRRVLQLFAHESRTAEQRCYEISSLSVAERFAQCLWRSEFRDDRGRLCLHENQTELAARIGTVREVVARLLSELVRERLLLRRRDPTRRCVSISLLDGAGLSNWVAGRSFQ